MRKLRLILSEAVMTAGRELGVALGRRRWEQLTPEEQFNRLRERL